MIKELLNKIQIVDKSNLNKLFVQLVKDDLIERFDGLNKEGLFNELVVFNINTRLEGIDLTDRSFIKAMIEDGVTLYVNKSIIDAIELQIKPELRFIYFTILNNLIKELI